MVTEREQALRAPYSSAGTARSSTLARPMRTLSAGWRFTATPVLR